MNEKVLQVFYGTDNLPYKDIARSVHFPIVGGAFLGASNTTEVRFYFGLIGDENATYVVSAKLPNGKQGYKLLEKVYDNDIGEWYASLQLSSFFTQVKGDLYISLRSYQGGAEIVYDDQNDIYHVEGDPVILGTGSIKLSIAYAVPYLQGDEEENVSFEDIYAEVGKKMDIISDDYIKTVNDISDSTEFDITEYPNGTVIYDRATKKFYKKIATSPYYELYPFSNFYIEADNTTTFKEIADLGHFVVVKIANHGWSNFQYLVAVQRFATTFYVFNIIEITTGIGRWCSGITATKTANIADDVTFASIIADDSQYRQDLQADNIVSISSGGTSTTSYNQNLIPYIAKPNCVINYDGEYYYPFSKSGSNITFVNPRPRTSSAQNAQGKVEKTIEIRYLTCYNVGTSPYVVRNAWYFDPYYATSVVNSSLGATFDLTMDSDYKITLALKSLNGTILKTETLDLPLESVVVSGEYDDATETIILTLENGNTIDIPVHDLVDGLVNQSDLEANYYNKIDIDTSLSGKVDKITSGSKIYATNNGTQVGLDYSAAPSGSGVAIRTAGSVQVPTTPPNSSCATNKTYVDSADNQKVDKTSAGDKVYGTDELGAQKTFDVDSDIVANGEIVRRNQTTGTVVVGTPTANSHASTKKYVDDSIASAISAVYRYKGTKTVAEINALTNQVIGDVYNVSDSGTLNSGNIQVRAGDNVAWTGTAWDKLAEDIDWEEYNETFMAAGFIQTGPFDTVPENLTFDANGDCTNNNWTGELQIDYMSPPITSLSISETPTTLTFDITQDYDNMITNADWTGIMTIEY